MSDGKTSGNRIAPGASTKRSMNTLKVFLNENNARKRSNMDPVMRGARQNARGERRRCGGAHHGGRRFAKQTTTHGSERGRGMRCPAGLVVVVAAAETRGVSVPSAASRSLAAATLLPQTDC